MTRLIFPFNYFDNWHYARYYDQIEALSHYFKEIIIPVNWGIIPGTIYENKIKNVSFMLNREPRNEVLTLKGKLKTLAMKATFLTHKRRKDKNRAMVNNFLDKGLDGDLVLSFSGAGNVQMTHCEIARRLGIKAVHRMRGNGVKERAQVMGIVGNLVENHYHNVSLKIYARHIPISHDYKEQLIKWGVNPGKISEPVTLGIDREQFKRTRSPCNLTIGYFGRVSKEKNIQFMFDIIRGTPEITYLIVGKNVEKISGFPDNAHYLGYVKKSEMSTYYDLVSAIINPSLSEGYPNILLEAYSTSTPVIGSPATFPLGVPVYGRKVDLVLEDWIETLNGLKIHNLKKQGKQASKWEGLNSWQDWGEQMSKELKKVL
jgi:glycosyltransferase involved in cell wall biosynthesis